MNYKNLNHITDLETQEEVKKFLLIDQADHSHNSGFHINLGKSRNYRKEIGLI
jgi:3-deoxy-D-arabino-heptulosonate 7-phosphate (DAHP) synthase class II